MGWAVGRDRDRQRHIGYGVPAICDHPGCVTSIDRGLSYACGGGVAGEVENCGLFFCGEHLSHWRDSDDPNGGGESVCARCAVDAMPFEAKGDTVEWVKHVSTDPSWQQWRDDNPEWLGRLLRGDAP